MFKRISLALALFLPFQVSAMGLHHLYDRMETELFDAADPSAITEKVGEELKSVQPDSMELRTLILEIYRRMAANPQADSRLRALQASWLMHLVPNQESVIREIKTFLQHDQASIRYQALIHLRLIYQSSPQWQMLAWNLIEDCERRARALPIHDVDRIQEELYLSRAVISLVVRADAPLIEPLFRLVLYSHSGVGKGQILDSDPLKDIKLSERTGDDTVVVGVLSLVADQASVKMLELRANPGMNSMGKNGALTRALKALTEVIIYKQVTEPRLLKRVRIFLDDPSVPRFASNELRSLFMTYFNEQDVPVSKCRILLFPQRPSA